MKVLIRRLTDDGRTIDMTPDGQFRSPPPVPPLGSAIPWSAKLLRWAVLVAVVAGALSLASLVLWFALVLIPIAVGAALVAYGVLRWRMWKARQAQTHLYRP